MRRLAVLGRGGCGGGAFVVGVRLLARPKWQREESGVYALSLTIYPAYRLNARAESQAEKLARYRLSSQTAARSKIARAHNLPKEAFRSAQGQPAAARTPQRRAQVSLTERLIFA